MTTDAPATPSRSTSAHALGTTRVEGSLFPVFRGRPDREHEMVVNRLVIGGLILLYLLVCRSLGLEGVDQPLAVVTVYWLTGLGFLGHILMSPGICPPRRIAAMMLDLGALSYGIAVGGETTAVLYPIYLWVVFGYGFRFGVRYLFAAMALAVVGFGIVATQPGYWGDHPKLAAGLGLGLVILPLYAASLIRKLSRATQEAEEASRQKSLFLASVSHELRTPLNAIIGMSGFLEETRLDAEQREMTRTINTAGRVLLDHINGILDFSRLEAGLMPSDQVGFDLHALVQETATLVRAQARTKGLALTFHIDAATPWRLRGNRKHLEEVLLNLAGNAVKFTEAGWVSIGCSGERDAAGGVVLRIAVSDSGIGIAPEARGRIFDSFAQADETIINRFGGTGLGLAIAKQLVELNGGAITVESTLGEGSVFAFTFRTQEEAPVEAQGDGPLVTDTSDGARLPVVVLSADADMADRLAALGADAAGFSERSAAAVHLRRMRGRALLVLDLRGSATDLGETLDALRDDAGEPVATLVVHDADRPLDAAARRRVASAVAGDADDATLAAGLRVAALAGGLMNRAAEAGAAAAAPTRRLHVLVAEDNVTNQKVVTRILEKEGHRVVVVCDGRAALDAMLAERFDVVLMDVNMPVMNGVLAAKLYRAARPEADDRSPIVALTADATPEAQRLCEEAGMVGCVTKPIEPQRLFAVIADIVRDEPARAFTHVADEPPEPVGDGTDRPALAERTLADLERLGGVAFRREVTDAFMADAAIILEALRDAVARGDAALFRDQMHALRSSAANIGAVGIYEIGLALRAVEETDLAVHGAERLQALTDEFARVTEALAARDGVRPGSVVELDEGGRLAQAAGSR